MKGNVLVLNSGSSSIMCGLYDGDDVALPPLGYGQIEGISAVARLSVIDRIVLFAIAIGGVMKNYDELEFLWSFAV